MKLYYMPGTCSLAVHIVLNETGASFALERVNRKTKQTESGENFRSINPHGYVPALQLESGDILLEVPAILQHVADSMPEAGLAPAAGTLERARLVQHLSYAAAELHKSFAPFYSGDPLDSEAREVALARLCSRMDYIETLLSDDRPYIMGDTYTVADAYLAVIATWTGPIDVDLCDWPAFAAYTRRITSRPAAEKAMRAEGLLN